MRAAVVERYGAPTVVDLHEVPVPEPARDQVLVRVHATAVTSADARIRAARFPPGFGVPARLAFGLRRPRRAILGSCLSGTVVAMGAGVAGRAIGAGLEGAAGTTPLRIDAEVAGMSGARMGTHAAFAVVRADRLVPKPAGVTHDDAAGLLFGATTAWYFLTERAHVRAGTRVLVNGASGAVGTNAVQLAAHLGAEVTAVTSTPNLGLARSLGAVEVVDHTVTTLAALDERYDVVFDTVGNCTRAIGRGLLRPDGRLILAVAGLLDTVRARGPVIAGPAPERVEDMRTLLAMVAAGDLRVVHDAGSPLPLEQIVEAHRRVDSGRKVGNLVVRPN